MCTHYVCINDSDHEMSVYLSYEWTWLVKLYLNYIHDPYWICPLCIKKSVNQICDEIECHTACGNRIDTIRISAYKKCKCRCVFAIRQVIPRWNHVDLQPNVMIHGYLYCVDALLLSMY